MSVLPEAPSCLENFSLEQLTIMMSLFRSFAFLIFLIDFGRVVLCSDEEGARGTVQKVQENNATVNYIRFNNNGNFVPQNAPDNHHVMISPDRQTLLNQCGGMYRNIQNLIDSPKFISPRPICNLRCEYQIVSPYICENEFHVQFLNFSLDTSKNCENEYVIINHDQVFCGRQVESRKFRTLGGILNITFGSKSFDMTQGRGFQLLVTRLPCIDDQNTLESIDLEMATTTDYPSFSVNSSIEVEDSRVGGGNPIYGNTTKGNRNTLSDPDIPVVTLPPPIYPGPPVGPIPLPVCCRNIYNQNRFVMLSQGFPAYMVSDNDCLYVIQRSSPNVCRLRIVFKFFNLDDLAAGELADVGCFNNFIEIEGRRFCGCRTSFVYETIWGGNEQAKVIRLKTSPGRYHRPQGFVFDVIQEDCPFKLQDARAKRSKRFVHLLKWLEAKKNTNQLPILPHHGFAGGVGPRNLDIDENFTPKFFSPTNGLLDGACAWNHLNMLQFKLETLSVPKLYCSTYF